MLAVKLCDSVRVQAVFVTDITLTETCAAI